jgi:heparosan-N-sulfate-glucuronate 5-epimerase
MSSVGLSDITIKCGDPALFTLPGGGYYLDMRPAIRLVESGYHGPRDEAGVPLTRYESGTDHYNAGTIAQYALALYEQALTVGRSPELDRKLQAQLSTLIRIVEGSGDWRGFYLCHWNSKKYPELRAPWASALSQGVAMSALLRGYRLFGDESMLRTAEACLNAFDRPLEEGGVRFIDPCGHVWFEEYPTNPPLHVLNGFIFALWGVLDYAKVTDSQKAWKWWSAGSETLKAHIADFDCGYWSVYDLRYRELVSIYYQLNIHVPQLEAMHLLTGEDAFKRYSERWSRFGNSFWRRCVWWAALRFQARTRALRARRLGSSLEHTGSIRAQENLPVTDESLPGSKDRQVAWSSER